MRSHRQRTRHVSEFDSLMGSSDMGDTSSSIEESSRDDETSSITGSIHSAGSSSTGTTRQSSSVSGSSYMGRYSGKRNVLNYK
ncbi:unnamed protein product [Ambrosiozyma monospora]|uniref:Unnamed protein product n=1 Tax=Ambrosiozyma monospora TaxID=43982 RepID=A0A9W6YRM1_AMBMO|nr:unnamed protein product [Ambrosiozyma monospora]